MRFLRGFLVGKARKERVQFFPVSVEPDDQGAEPFVHCHLIDAGERKDPGFQKIRLVHAHDRLYGFQPGSSRTLMKNLKSHI